MILLLEIFSVMLLLEVFSVMLLLGFIQPTECRTHGIDVCKN
jgi:hypothetical protein